MSDGGCSLGSLRREVGRLTTKKPVKFFIAFLDFFCGKSLQTISKLIRFGPLFRESPSPESGAYEEELFRMYEL